MIMIIIIWSYNVWKAKDRVKCGSQQRWPQWLEKCLLILWFVKDDDHSRNEKERKKERKTTEQIIDWTRLCSDFLKLSRRSRSSRSVDARGDDQIEKERRGGGGVGGGEGRRPDVRWIDWSVMNLAIFFSSSLLSSSSTSTITTIISRRRRRRKKTQERRG